jgi:hypothetical protein
LRFAPARDADIDQSPFNSPLIQNSIEAETQSINNSVGSIPAHRIAKFRYLPPPFDVSDGKRRTVRHQISFTRLQPRRRRNCESSIMELAKA